MHATASPSLVSNPPRPLAPRGVLTREHAPAEAASPAVFPLTPYERGVPRLRGANAVVPSLWAVEVANILLAGERRGRLTAAHTATFLRSLEALPIAVDQTTASRARGPVLDLARAQHVIAYDACYLDLALQLSLPIATQDAQLRTAASRVGAAPMS